MSKIPTFWLASALLVVMAVLMIGPARQDSATVDETTVLGAGYTYFNGYRYKFQPEHPPLSQMLPVIPLLSMDLKMSDDARVLLMGRVGYPWTVPWFGPVRPVQELFPAGRDNWYFWALPEGQLFGQMFVYGSGNDAEAMLFSARCLQILLALGVGLLIFWWVWHATTNTFAALAALAAWVFNPNALAYGHLASTGDISVTLGITAAVFFFACWLEKMTTKNAGIAGIATGIALLMKFTAVTLGPIFMVLAALSWNRLRDSGQKLWKPLVAMAGMTWLVLLIMYAPRWSPAPALSEQQAYALGVPGWFTEFRTLLIPADFFKGLALTLGHSKMGHDAYLMGDWSHSGWWYYYPVAFFFKNSLAFVILIAAGAVLFVKRTEWKIVRPLEFTPWVATIVYLLAAMTSKVNIGVRHLLPIFPLLCIGIGLALANVSNRSLQRMAWALLGWQSLVALLAYPLYVQFFSEAVGGATNGYKYLIDSNYDWGQDAKRLKAFLDEHHIGQIYLDYFGTQYSIEYLKIPNTRIDADKARQIQQGWLVVSASQLMRPEWAWLRESRQPFARVADTLFVYQF